MHPTLVFDIETIPDLTGFATVNGIDVSTLPQAELTEMALLARRQKTGSDWMPHHLHRIVAISCALRSGNTLKVWSLGKPDSSEAELIQQFFDNIEPDAPQLVSWNGSGFALPVLHYRALVHGIAATRYWGTHNDGKKIKREPGPHLDLMDVLSMYQPRASAPLDDMARLCGFPGKQGLNGSTVLETFQHGKIDTIRHACETGAMNTWLVHLRFQKMCGGLSDTDYATEIELVRSTLSLHDAPHWQTFMAAWA